MAMAGELSPRRAAKYLEVQLDADKAELRRAYRAAAR